MDMRCRNAFLFDVRVEHHGSLVLLRPLSDEGKDWLVANTDADARWFDEALVCEPPQLGDIIQALEDDHLDVALY